MCFRGHHFLIIYYTVIHDDLDPFCSVRNPCALHLIAFVHNLAHFLLGYFGSITFLEYDSGLSSIEHCNIWGSVTVAELFQDYKTTATPCLEGFCCETFELFPLWVFLGIWDLAMI